MLLLFKLSLKNFEEHPVPQNQQTPTGVRKNKSEVVQPYGGAWQTDNAVMTNDINIKIILLFIIIPIVNHHPNPF